MSEPQRHFESKTERAGTEGNSHPSFCADTHLTGPTVIMAMSPSPTATPLARSCIPPPPFPPCSPSPIWLYSVLHCLPTPLRPPPPPPRPRPLLPSVFFVVSLFPLLLFFSLFSFLFPPRHLFGFTQFCTVYRPPPPPHPHPTPSNPPLPHPYFLVHFIPTMTFLHPLLLVPFCFMCPLPYYLVSELLGRYGNQSEAVTLLLLIVDI